MMSRLAFIVAALWALPLSVSCIPDAHASPTYAVSAAGIAHQAADLGPGYLDSFAVTCGTTATKVTAPGAISIWCNNNSATAVHIGGPNVTTSNTPCYSTGEGCGSRFTAPVREAYCRVASSTLAIQCTALVPRAVTPPPSSPDAGTDGGS
jgi:hypothetical protein